MKKRILALLLATAMLLTISACTNPQNSDNLASVDGSYTVTDSRGVEVTFEKVPERIISLLPSDTEIIYALDEGDKLIAVSEYCNYPEDTNNKTKLQSGDRTSIEAVIGMSPDLVIAGRMDQTVDQFKQLEDAGIRVFVTDAYNIEDTYKIIDMLGAVLKKENKATDVINSMKQDFEDVKEQVKNKPQSTVYIEISPLKYELWTCGKGTFHDEILTIIGVTNIFSDVDGWQKVSEEQVLNRNPEIIITTSGPMFDSEADTVNEIKNRANWGVVDAVKNGKVFTTDSDAIQRPGPRLATAAKELMKIIYG